MHIEELQPWIGRERVENDELTLFPARGMCALLNRDPQSLEHGSPLPHGWHWLYFKPLARQSDLGEDGHERRGTFLPPVPLPRRMWAGGRMRFHAPLRLGEAVRRTSTIARIEEKEGRSGTLVFVDVRYRIEGPDGPAVDEVQTLVYREAAEGSAAGERGRAAGAADRPSQAGLPEAPGSAVEARWRERFDATEVALFRFSALTFNGHRIHYDRPYATGREGHAGIVVHAPLLALLLMDAAIRNEPDRTALEFVYRAVAPLDAPSPLLLEGTPAAHGRTDWRAAAESGTTAMNAAVEWRAAAGRAGDDTPPPDDVSGRS